MGIWVEEVVEVKGRRSGDSIRDKVCKVKSGLFILYFSSHRLSEEGELG